MALANIIICWIYKFIFPINGLLDYLFVGLWSSLGIGITIMYFGVLAILINLMPNTRIASLILLLIHLAMNISGYYWGHFDFSQLPTKVNLFLVVVTALVLSYKSYYLPENVE